MNSTIAQGGYLFQGNTLVRPEGSSDAPLYEPIPLEQIRRDFSGSAVIVDIPALDAQRPIKSAELAIEMPLPPGWERLPMRQALMTGEAVHEDSGGLGRLLRAYHIVQWRRESLFCGACGSKNSDAAGELARLCPVCGRVEYPRIAPAIIVIIINDEGQVLLAHNKKFTPGVYSLIAGFNEAGESLEATVIREVREEVGLELRDIRYAVSQPWPFPYSLMLGFTARYAAGTIRPDEVEIEDARWFDRDHLPELPGKGSVSRLLINSWAEGRNE